MATVLVKIVGREVIPEVRMNQSATVLDLKEKIETTLNVGVGRQTVKLNSRVLMNDQTIGGVLPMSDQTVCNSNTQQHLSVVLSVKPLAGQPKFHISVERACCYVPQRASLKVKENTLVSEVKVRIRKEWHCPGRLITLNHLSVLMDDDFPLSAYYVSEGSKLEAVMDY